MMKIVQTLCLLCLTMAVSNTAKATNVDLLFNRGSLQQAQTQAAQQGKLYLVDFEAKWCLPCKWMDETTFSDPSVSNYLSDNYIPVKVDIDDFDGFNYKQEYNIQVLPSILIFNSKGDLVGRYEESMTPSAMMEILENHNTPENRIQTMVVEEEIIEAPTYTVPSLEEEYEAPVIEETVVEVYEEEVIEETYTEVIQEDIAINTIESAGAPLVEEEIINTSFFKLNASPTQKIGFSVQIGVFANYQNVITESAKYERNFQSDIIVQVTELNGQTVFKVLVGQFSYIEDAHNLRRAIENTGVPAITKDLASL